MTNNEIIVEELENYTSEYLDEHFNKVIPKLKNLKKEKNYSKKANKIQEDFDRDFNKRFASSLLKKLNRLDREKVEKIFDDYSATLECECGRYIKDIIVSESFKEAVDQILQLILEEGEVVAEGNFAIEPDGSLWIGEYPLRNLIKHKGKILIREVK
jgi:ERCC4-related helicase